MPSATNTQDQTNAGLSISIRFITDRCVTTNISSRDEPEWPPHPGRIFMAMAAAFFESEGTTQEKQAERDALDWLTTLDPPLIWHQQASLRSPYTCYVPVNDNQKPNKAMLQSAQGLPRSRQPRTFPTVVPEGDMHVRLCWFSDEIPDHHFAAIDRICRNVIRVGHSSSLVMMWTDDTAAEIDDSWLVPTDGAAKSNVRIASPGELHRLEEACRADQINHFADLAERIATTKGKEKSESKTEFKTQFGEAYKSTLRPPEPLPPTIGTWQGYRRPASTEQQETANTYFDRELLIFRVDGPTLSIERCLSLTRALRDKAMAACPIQPPPEWLSGHAEDGSPSSTPHAAFLPLPYAGSKWADGHIIGVAIAVPRSVPAEERSRCLAELVIDQKSGDTKAIPFRLWGHQLPDFEVKLCQEASPPISLSNETWTKASRVWNSVTPVVLDRFPKPSKSEDRSKWLDSVRRIIAKSCEHGGLPIPRQIHVSTTAFVKGIARAVIKKRRANRGQETTSSLGDGFPSLAHSKRQSSRPQLHVKLEFDDLVVGPVVIGAGRFAGYGLFQPGEQRP